MSLNPGDYQHRAQAATRMFWGNRSDALARQTAANKLDQGTRGSVTAGNNMDGFAALLADLIESIGGPNFQTYFRRNDLALPGFFRPSKRWDIVVTRKGRLVAAIELKSQVGSFGNNFNNRVEEAIGNAWDLRASCRASDFGQHPRPFLGWLMMVEEAPMSTGPVRLDPTHFAPSQEFYHSSYLQRYDIFCQRLMSEGLYDAAALMASTQEAKTSGVFNDLSEATSFHSMVRRIATYFAHARRLDDSDGDAL